MANKNESPNIYQRICEIMKDVRYIQKQDKAKNLYTFVSHDSVAKALHDPLAKHGVVMLPSVSELKQDGNRTTAKVDVTFVNADNPSETFVVTHWGYGIDNQDKGVGKAISYAVKYCLLKTFCLETGDDVEKDNQEFKPDTSMITPEEIQLITEKCRGNSEALGYIKNTAGGNLEKLERSRLTGVIKWLDDPNNKFFKKQEVLANA